MMKKFKKQFVSRYTAPLVILLLVLVSWMSVKSLGTTITGLTVNYAENPIGIEKTNILFSWKMESDIIGQSQTAYQLSVTEENGKEIWNSGNVASGLSIGINYKGPALNSETRYLWSVAVTDSNGKLIKSGTAYFETGTEFKNAEWIYYKTPALNCFNDSYIIKFTPTIINGGFTLYFGIKNESNRFSWSFTDKLLTATKTAVNGNVQLDTIGLRSIVSLNTPFDLEIIVTKESIATQINGKQISSVKNSYTIERPYVGLMVAGAAVDRRTQAVTRPAQSARFTNLNITVDNISENVGEPDFTLTPVTPAPATGQAAMSGFGGVATAGASLNQSSFQGKPVQYIAESTAMPIFRTEKALKGSVKSARLYITSLGVFDAFINGKEVMAKGSDGKIYDDAFSPGWTNYNDYIFYRTYDVTSYLSGTKAVLGVRLGTGWYAGYIGRQYYGTIGADDVNELALLARLVITYADGSQEIISSNANDWTATEKGPILSNDFFFGEVYDARLESEIKGWDAPGFNASGWGKVSKLDYSVQLIGGSENTAYLLEDDRIYPKANNGTYIYDPEAIKMTTGLKYGEIVPTVVDPTKDITLPKGKRLIVDIGQNLAGVTAISFSGAEGTAVRMRGAEMLSDGRSNPDVTSGGGFGPKGTLYWYGLTRGRAAEDTWYTDTYYMNNEAIQNYRASFTFHGYRYLEVYADNDIVIHSVYAQPITSAVKQTGFIETNNKNVNQLFANSLWSQMGNFLTIPTDCPNRSERLGWSGDVTVFTETALYNFDAVSFLGNYMDISQNYAKNNGGYYGTTMPGGSRGTGSSNAGWTDVSIILTWAMYQQTGDIAILEKNYEMLANYMAMVMKEGLRAGYGDWVAFQATSAAYMAVMYQAYDAILMSKIASALNLADDVKKYNTEYDRLVTAMRTKYVDDKSNLLVVSADKVTGGGAFGANIVLDNSQTGILWALKMGLPKSEEEKQIMIKNLLTNIDNKAAQIRSNAAEKTLSTGFLGVNVMLPVLTENGLANTAYDLLLQDEMPSWLYEVKNGATTTWERWNAYSTEKSFGDSGMNSFNHYAYGAVGEWMFEYMAGIQKDESEPGFKNVILQPSIDKGNKYNDQERINSVMGRYDSYYGSIISNWTSDGEKLTKYDVVVPANTTATLYLPVDSSITENSMSSFKNVTGVTYKGLTTRNGNEVAIFELLAGGFTFEFLDGKLGARLQKGYVKK